MKLDDVYPSIVERLQRQGQLLHSQLLQMTGGDESMLHAIRSRLLADSLAVERLGVMFVSGGTSIIGKTDEPRTEPMTASLPRSEQSVGWAVPSKTTRVAPIPVNVPQPAKNAALATPTNRGLVGTAHPTGNGLTASRSADRLRVNRPPPAAPLRYYLWNAGRETGPFPREELEQRLAEGRLQPTDFVRVDQDDEWIPAVQALRRTSVTARKETSGVTANTNSESSTVTPTKNRSEELSTAIARAVASNRRTPRPTSNPLLNTASSAAVVVSPLAASSDSGWRRMTSRLSSGLMRNFSAVLLLGCGAWVYGIWSPAARSIEAELNGIHMQLRALHVRNPSPTSPEWRRFVALHTPRLKKLVATLKPLATGQRPERHLLYAAERGLLTMLDEGLDGPAEKKFGLHMGNAIRVLSGEKIELEGEGIASTRPPPPGSIKGKSGPSDSPAASPSTQESPPPSSVVLPPGAPGSTRK